MKSYVCAICLIYNINITMGALFHIESESLTEPTRLSGYGWLESEDVNLRP